MRRGRRKPLLAAIEPELADRLIFRTCAAMIDACRGRRALAADGRPSVEPVRISITRPAALHGLGSEELFGAAGGTVEGFYLRLVRGLARVAGAELGASASAVTLTFRSA